MFEESIQTQGYFKIGKWVFIQGNKSMDFYLKDNEKGGYFRFGQTEDKHNML